MPFGVDEPEAAGYGSSLTIEELGPAGPGWQPRKLVLSGSTLPFQGAEWGIENRIPTTWYSGNFAEASQQVLGPKELPSTWEGEWKRTLMSRTPAIYSDENGGEQRIISPMLLRSTLEAIALAGVRLRVTWTVRGVEAVGSSSGGEVHVGRNPDGSVRRDRVSSPRTRPVLAQIAREGRVATFRTPITTHADVRWSIEFTWVGRGARSARVQTEREDEAAAAAALALEASVDATLSLSLDQVYASDKSIRKSVSKLTLGQLENIAGAPQKAVTAFTRQLQQNVSDFKRVGQIAKKFSSQPLAVTNAVVDFARNTINVANNFTDEMGRRPYELNASKQKVNALLRSAKAFGSMTDAAALNARRAQQLEAAHRAILVSGANRGALTVRESATTRAGDLLAIHICKTGETPQSVSQLYYGNPDQAATILHSNRLPLYTPAFRPGQIVVIPAMANTAARASV